MVEADGQPLVVACSGDRVSEATARSRRNLSSSIDASRCTLDDKTSLTLSLPSRGRCPRRRRPLGPRPSLALVSNKQRCSRDSAMSAAVEMPRPASVEPKGVAALIG